MRVHGAVLLRTRSVPVGAHRLIVPHGGRLGVADVARVARVVRGVNKQRLNRERPKIPHLEVRHVVLPTEMGVC